MLHEPIRKHFRRHVLLDCQVVREHDFKLVADLAVDMSPRGMRVRAKAPVAGAPRSMPVLTGEEVLVSFKPPRSNTWIDTHGVIARVVHGRRPGDNGMAYGIEFSALSIDEEHRLFEHLRGMARPDAQRPPRPLA